VKRRTTFVRDGVTIVMEDGILDAEIPIGDGVAKWFHENGTVRAEVPKIAGETHGTAYEWHDNGQLASETTIIHGQIRGVTRNWNRNGSLASEMEYVTPHAIYAKSYDKHGKIRHVFLWIGKPVSKARWLKKLETAGIPKSELERRFSTSAKSKPNDG
jgi:antitoxin component YwqK of YwqJK toxin-antitoxin module